VVQTLASAFVASRRASPDPHALVIHAQPDWLAGVQDGSFDFVRKLRRHATGIGMSSRVVAAGGSASRLLFEQNHINIVVGDQPSYGPNRLHALPGYLWGFWYLDEIGVFANSSLRFARFNPGDVDGDKAAYFFNGVSGYMQRENVSKLAQEARTKSPMTPAAAVVFCQEIEEAAARQHYLNTEEMIRTTAAACRDELVYVKPHPSQSKYGRKAVLDISADYQNVRVSDASVHDLIGVSRCVVTQNSAAGFEAFMQKRCVITCAKSDYWHATLTPKKSGDLREVLTYGPEAMADFPYEKYFYWFLAKNCLEPAKDDFEKRAWARIKDKFFL
jgi:hypothetical protein